MAHTATAAAHNTAAAVSILSADEALATGLYPSAFLSIAKIQESAGNFAAGQRARLVGRELAVLRGIDLGGRAVSRKRVNNDNTRQRAGKRAA